MRDAVDRLFAPYMYQYLQVYENFMKYKIMKYFIELYYSQKKWKWRRSRFGWEGVVWYLTFYNKFV